MNIPFEALFSMPPALQQDLIGSARNYYPTRYPDRVLGMRTNINNTRIDLWEGPTATYNFPAAGIQMYVKSDSVNDTANGTGARTVHVHMLDGNWNEVTVASTTVSMNGNTPVAIGPTNALRVDAFHAASFGNLGTCAGNISLTDVTGNITYGYISAGENFARQAIYSVPSGYNGYISGWRASSGSAGNHVCRITLRATSHNGILYPSAFLAIDEILTQNGGDSFIFPQPVWIPPMVDVKLSAIADASNAGCTAGGMIMGWTEPV